MVLRQGSFGYHRAGCWELSWECRIGSPVHWRKVGEPYDDFDQLPDLSLGAGLFSLLCAYDKSPRPTCMVRFRVRRL